MATEFICEAVTSTQPLFRKQCVSCSAEIFVKNRRSEYCKPCVLSVVRARCNETRAANARARLARVCQQCAKPFVMRRTGKSYEGKFCSRECLATNKRKYESRSARKKAEKLRAKDRLGPVAPKEPKPRVTKQCIACGSMSTRAACSAPCRLEVLRRERASFFVSEVCKCEECKSEFSTIYGAARRKYCSDRCARKHAKRITKAIDRARLRKAAIETVNPIKVFERDKWKCQFCGIKTPRSLRGTNEDSAPELDHIHPLSKGGAHSYANTQCLCRKCNGSKGAALIGQLRMFG